MSISLSYKFKTALLRYRGLITEIEILAAANDDKSREKLTYIISKCDNFDLRIAGKNLALRRDVDAFEKLLKQMKPETTEENMLEVFTWLDLAFKLNNSRMAEIVLRNPARCDLRGKEGDLARWLMKDSPALPDRWQAVGAGFGDNYIYLEEIKPEQRCERCPEAMIWAFVHSGADMKKVKSEIAYHIAHRIKQEEEKGQALGEYAASLNDMIDKAVASNTNSLKSKQHYRP